jgi:tetratricopeptide (TPR) repeat protein
MKRKSVGFTFFISLLALVFMISLPSPLLAQKTSDDGNSDQTQGTTATMPSAGSGAAGATATKKVEPVKNADYWFDRGALCATYGNDPAAIKFFQKAITLDPNRSGAYFEQGISYGQLGEFGKAIPLINRAIDMEPQNGLYIYGRGRVYLLAGDRGKAMADFKKAAALDDEDAQTYLETISQTE